MIYTVKLGSDIIYVPGDHEYAITNAVLDESLNDAGAFEFSVPPTNPLYEDVTERAEVTIQKDGKDYWWGFILEVKVNLYKEKKVYCVGELSYLNDSIQPQARYTGQTVLGLFTEYVNIHNSQVPSAQQFEVGVVTVPETTMYRFTNYETTLTALRQDFCEDLEGYLRIRHKNGHRYLDLVTLNDYGKTCGQPIEFGYNLLDYNQNSTVVNLASAILPLGARLDTSPIEGLDAYVDIKSVNAGNDWIESPAAVSNFGLIKKVVHWDDVNEPSILKTKAQAWLTANQFAELSLEIKIIDMSILNESIPAVKWKDLAGKTWNDLAGVTWEQLAPYNGEQDEIGLGDRIRALAEPYGMDTWFPVQSKRTYLQDPTQSTITLSGKKQRNYTQQQATANAELNQKIPQESAWLSEAEQNAKDIVDLATEGEIFIEKDEATGRPKEIKVMNATTEEQATKMWKFNLNGWYEATRPNVSSDWDTQLAAVLGQGMLADFITAGVLKLGGVSNDTILEIYDTANQRIGRWNSNGIEITKGQIDILANSLEDLDKVKVHYDILSASLSPAGIFTKYGNNILSAYLHNQMYLNNTSMTNNTIIEPEAVHIGESIGIWHSQALFVQGAGYATGGFSGGSARELKENINPYKENAIDKINDIDIVSFNLKDDKNKDFKVGFIADDTDELFATREHNAIDYNNCIGMLLKAVQELSHEVNELKNNNQESNPTEEV